MRPSGDRGRRRGPGALTQSGEEPAEQAEQEQLPDLLETLLQHAEATAPGQLLPQQQPGGQLHPRVLLGQEQILLGFRTERTTKRC